MPRARLAAGRRVSELEALGVPAGLRDRDEHAGVDARAGGTPDGGLGHRAQGVDAPAQPGWHDLDDLGEGADGRLRHPGDRVVLDGGLQAHRQGHRLVVVEDQRRQSGTRRELVAAVDAALGVDGVAELAQPVDVASQRPHRHPEPVGEVSPGPVAVILQERQKPQGAGGRVGHGA